jgi:hypothetical protein
VVTSVGDREITLGKAVSYNFKVLLREAEILNEVVIFTGKIKNGQPCSGILRKIWERKRKNGLYLFDQYQMEKYEKIEFDMNTIDSAL